MVWGGLGHIYEGLSKTSRKSALNLILNLKTKWNIEIDTEQLIIYLYTEFNTSTCIGYLIMVYVTTFCKFFRW